jgi:hypothetical protein
MPLIHITTCYVQFTNDNVVVYLIIHLPYDNGQKGISYQTFKYFDSDWTVIGLWVALLILYLFIVLPPAQQRTVAQPSYAPSEVTSFGQSSLYDVVESHPSW